ncbi:tetratricopeptide repeat protein, partial [Candidatus Woesearchaeota archaeon]|nr:tetratricopeptide repeat protein [Candidatus Woesearchaeota archaeon]
KLIELFPEQTGDDCPYELLAAIHRELKEPEEERRVLEEYSRRTDSAVPALLRLAELQLSDRDWTSLIETSRLLIAINPLLPQVQRFRASAAEALGQTDDALTALRALLQLSPNDPAELHYRLATLLKLSDRDQAKRHVLAALEAAPRYRDAQRLLLEIVRSGKKEE